MTLREVEWLPYGWASEPGLNSLPIDSVRSYDAWAPGAFAYAQGRWTSGGLVLNAGLRAEYFTAGPQASHQTLPWASRGVCSRSRPASGSPTRSRCATCSRSPTCASSRPPGATSSTTGAW